MPTIYFCTELKLKELTPITKNVDINDVIINVKPSADMYVRSILGTYFYNDLLVKYNAQTMSPDELNLLDYIQYAVAWRAATESVITLSYQLKNKGVQTQSGDFSNNADYKEVMFLNHHYADKASFYDNRLFQYLVKNKDLFPVFMSHDNSDSTAAHSCRFDDNNFNQNIFFI